MGWFDDYDRNYRSDRDRGRGGYPPAYGNMGAANGFGYWNTPYGYWGGGYDAGYRGRGSAGYGADYGYDRMYRRPPEDSPAYGRGGDREVQRWATRHGYDAGFTIEPHESGGMGGRGGGRQGSQGRQGGYADRSRPQGRMYGQGQDRQNERFGARGGNRGFQGGSNEGWGSDRYRGDRGYGW
jgi:hypothetical protein